jgi:hypothetical protein
MISIRINFIGIRIHQDDAFPIRQRCKFSVSEFSLGGTTGAMEIEDHIGAGILLESCWQPQQVIALNSSTGYQAA